MDYPPRTANETVTSVEKGWVSGQGKFQVACSRGGGQDTECARVPGKPQVRDPGSPAGPVAYQCKVIHEKRRIAAASVIDTIDEDIEQGVVGYRITGNLIR